MSQVCFTTYFSEWGKGSREGYSIYYYARAGARASEPCKKNPERWKFLPDGTKNILEGWSSLSDDTKKNPEILPEEGKKYSFGRKIHSGKWGFFLWKAPEKVRKWWKRGEKFLSFPTKKTWKISGLSGKTCLKTRWQKQKKADFSFEKVPRKQKNYGNRQKIFSAPHKKGRKNYPDEAKKSQKTDDPDGKSSRFFVGGRKNTEMHGKRSWKIYRIIRKKHEKYTADRNKFYHWRTVGLKKTDFSTGKVKRKKQKNPQSA